MRFAEIFKTELFSKYKQKAGCYINEIYDITRIIIAQRIASVKNADRIVVMDNGRLADVGSHSELIKTSEIYKDIYESQLKGNE